MLPAMSARLKLILANISLATVAVAVIQRLFGFPPLIVFVVPPAIVFRVSGLWTAFITALIAAVVGDYFFVAPTGEVTVHAEGLGLLLLLLLGTALLPFVTPRAEIRKS